MKLLHPLPTSAALRFIIFDHDGTLTTLRRGWEQIMEPVMVAAILGRAAEEIGREEHDEILQAVRSLIDRTTGVQTLVQMQSLVEMVGEYGFVPKHQILKASQYKAIYKQQLDAMVHQRIEQVHRGERQRSDILIPGTVELLSQLHLRDVTLYLCSGSDQADIEQDINLLGFGEYFNGGIHGAVGDIAIEAKRIVLDQIMNQIDGDMQQVLTLGDGPVEIRETKVRGGIAIGIASNENAPGTIDAGKHERLCNAGADAIIADWRDEDFLQWLGIE